MKKKTKKSKQEAERQLKENPINVFTCCEKTMELKEFQEHLILHHKLTTQQMKGKKSMLAHLDGDYWFSYTYAWELESGLKFTQHIEQVRADDDMMRYCD